MTQAEAKKILVKALSVLNNRQRDNLRWHLEHKTKIACGQLAYEWDFDGCL